MTSKPLVYLGVIIIIIAVVAAAGYIIKGSPSGSVTDTIVEPVNEPVDIATTTVVKSFWSQVPYPADSRIDTSSWKLYVDKSKRYSIEYPANLILGTAGDTFSFVFPKNTYFHWPLLDDAKVTVSIGDRCPGLVSGNDDFAATSTVNLNGYAFNRKVGTDAAAGNRYFEITYDTSVGGKCYQISFYNHGANGAGMYVDLASLVAKYDAQHETDLIATIHMYNAMVKTFRILAK